VTLRYRVEYLTSARRDLVDIVTYLRRDSPATAARLIDELEASIGGLARHPKPGNEPRAGRLQRLGYRILVVGDYLVFYVFKTRRVQIRRVLHGARRYSFLLR